MNSRVAVGGPVRGERWRWLLYVVMAFLGALLTFVGARAQQQATDQARFRALIDAYNEAWNAQDLNTLCAFHADDIVFENQTAGERAEGTAAVRAHIGGIFERWPSLRFRRRRMYVADDFVVGEWTASAVRCPTASTRPHRHRGSRVRRQVRSVRRPKPPPGSTKSTGKKKLATESAARALRVS